MTQEEDSSSEDSLSEDSLSELYENNPSEYWAMMDEEHGTDYLRCLVDPYNIDQTLLDYLGEGDSSCTNEELGLNSDGEREDY